MGEMIPRRIFFLLLIASALVLIEISPTNGTWCLNCNDTLSGKVPCTFEENATEMENSASLNCAYFKTWCTREINNPDCVDPNSNISANCVISVKENCFEPKSLCACHSDDCNSNPECSCSAGYGGKNGSGGIKKDKLDSSHSALIHGAASTLMALMGATFTFMIQRSSF